MKRRASRSLLSLFGLVGVVIVAVAALPLVYARASGPVVSAATDLPSSAAVSGESLSSVHVAQDWNAWSEHTRIDHPLADGNPNAILLITQNHNPGAVAGVHNPHEIGVWYVPGAQQWTICNQDMASMPLGAAFNVLVAPYGCSCPSWCASLAYLAEEREVRDVSPT